MIIFGAEARNRRGSDSAFILVPGSSREVYRYSGKASFNSSDISKYIAMTHKDSEIYVVGVCTHICIHDIVAGIVNEFKNRHDKLPDLKILKDMTGDFDIEMADFALKRLKNLYGVEVI